ncbi:MAG: UvrD-helicase domain-containing protein [Bdellovibrionaceae bacterium]|nr:UvrD-helicase domain-containing protein [Pseudobdellovibrionaceae bacterium]MDW8190061.1 UvrD-helicase domain-containing protein [Pseudobdellovibrionaceae bacterium]
MSSTTSSNLKIYDPAKGQKKWIIVHAGAGAGKTTELISRVISFGIEFYRNHKRMPNIVLTTFTVKATEEIRERLTKAANQIQDSIPLPKRDLADWLSSNQVFVTTIHGLIIRFLQKKGNFFGLFSDFKVVNENIFSSFFKKYYFEILPNDQNLLSTVDQLIENYGYNTFIQLTQQLVQRIIAGDPIKPYESQWDLSYWQEQAHYHLSALNETLQLIDQDQIKTASQKETFKKLRDLLDYSITTPEQLRQYLFEAQISARSKFHPPDVGNKLKYHLTALRELAQDEWLTNNLKETENISFEFFKISQALTNPWLKHLKNLQKIPLVDIEPIGLHLLANDPSIAQSFSEEWDYWYIDEFQDTSPIQIRILKHLMGNSCGFFVGDPQQSIYLFRGSRSKVFFDQIYSIKDQNGSVIYLQKNYRSSKNVLDFINTVTQLMAYNNFIPMELGVSESSDHGSVEIIPWKTEHIRRESIDQWLISAIPSIVLKLMVTESRNLHQIAILCFENKDLEIISQGLTRLQIPHQLHSPSNFFEKREVTSALSLLRFICFPEDNENLFFILLQPWCGFSSNYLQQLTNITKVESPSCLWEQLLKQFPDHSVTKTLELLNQQSLNKGIFETWLHSLNYFQLWSYYEIESQSKSHDNSIWQCIVFVSNEMRSPSFSWSQFWHKAKLNRMGLKKETIVTADIQKNKVQLMTIHASKGLEFETVIFPNFPKTNNNRFPYLLFDENSGSFAVKSLNYKVPWVNRQESELKKLLLAEKERVWYVAITRARKNLIIPFLFDHKKTNEIANSENQDLFQNPGLVLNKFVKEESIQVFPYPNDLPDEIIRSSTKSKPIRKHISPVSFVTQNANSTTNSKVTTTHQLVHSEDSDFLLPHLKGIFFHQQIDQFIKKNKHLENKHLGDFNDQLSTHLSLWTIEQIYHLTHQLDVYYSEWSYSKLDEFGNVRVRRIDFWGISHKNKKIIIVDFKSGDSYPIVDGFQQLSEYARDLASSHVIPIGYNILLRLMLTRAEKIFDQEWQG